MSRGRQEQVLGCCPDGLCVGEQGIGDEEGIGDDVGEVSLPTSEGIGLGRVLSGRALLEREADVLEELSGALTGVYAPDELAELRDEWD